MVLGEAYLKGILRPPLADPSALPPNPPHPFQTNVGFYLKQRFFKHHTPLVFGFAVAIWAFTAADGAMSGAKTRSYEEAIAAGRTPGELRQCRGAGMGRGVRGAARSGSRGSRGSARRARAAAARGAAVARAAAARGVACTRMRATLHVHRAARRWTQPAAAWHVLVVEAATCHAAALCVLGPHAAAADAARLTTLHG